MHHNPKPWDKAELNEAKLKTRDEAKLTVRLLNGLDVTFGGLSLSRFRIGNTAILLACLCLALPDEVDAENVAAWLWPDKARDVRLNNLRVTLFKLKKDLKDHLRLDDLFVESLFRRKHRVLRIDPDLVLTDVAAFRQCRAQAEEAERAGDLSEERRWLDEADQLYGTGFLTGISGEWAAAHRKDFAQQRLAVLGRLTTVRKQAGDAAGSEDAAVRLKQQEIAYRKAFPAADERRLAALPPLLGKATTLVDHYHGLLDGGGDIVPTARLLVLSGPDGVGRSRLAREIAATFRDWRDYLSHAVSAAGLARGEDVFEATARALGLTRQAAPYSTQIATFLHCRQTVLLIDDLEPGAAVEPLRFLLQDVRLEPGARLVILATGKEPIPWPLDLVGQLAERAITHEVQPLRMPAISGIQTPERLQKIASVQLFAHCARAATGHFHLTGDNAHSVVQLCRLTAGMPEGLRVMASWTAQFSPEQLAALLGSRMASFGTGAGSGTISVSGTAGSGTRSAAGTARENPMHGVHALSYSLLAPPVQRLFRAMTVFHGGATAEALGAISGEPLAREHLATLARYRLVRERDTKVGARYDLAGAAAAFARTLTPLSEQSPVIERRHTEYFVGLAAEVRQNSRGPGQGRELDRLAQEHDNLQAALTRCLPLAVTSHKTVSPYTVSPKTIRRRDPVAKSNPSHSGDPIPDDEAGSLPGQAASRTDQAASLQGLRLTVLLWEFWNQRGDWQYGRSWLERALAATRGFASHDDRAAAANAVGVIAAEQGDLDEAWDSARLSVQLADAWVVQAAHSEAIREAIGRRAEAHNTCGYVARRQAERSQQEEEIDQALDFLGAARAAYEMAASDYEAAWGDLSVFWPCNGLGHVALREYDLLKAGGSRQPPDADTQRRMAAALSEGARWLERSLSIALRTGDQGSLAQALCSLADATFAQGQQGESGKYGLTWIYLDKCLAIWRDVGDWGSMAVCAERLARLAVVEGSWGKAMRLCGMAWVMRLHVRRSSEAPDPDGYRRAMQASLEEWSSPVDTTNAGVDTTDAEAEFQWGRDAMERDSSSAASAARLVLDAPAW